jgi:pimeloyl-ACP methyl ester carboxylesterase
MSPHRFPLSLVAPLLALALLAPFAAAQDATPPATPAAAASPAIFERDVDVGGRSLHVSCLGSGSPTVVFEARMGWSGVLYFDVQQEVARFTRACTYDRANVATGQSDPAPTPRTCDDIVADLEALLAAAGISGPYVLVGRGFGYLPLRLFAERHPADVAGMVLADVSLEDWLARSVAVLTEDQRAAWQAFFEANPEQVDYAGCEEAVRAAGPPPPVPLVVLVHGQEEPDYFPPGADVAAATALYRELHAELAASAPGGRLVVAEESVDVLFDRPELVVEAIRQVVAAARDPGTWATPTSGTPEAATPAP